MPAAALAAPVKPKETVKNPVGSTFSLESNSLAPKRDGEDVQVCYAILSGCCPSNHLLKGVICSNNSFFSFGQNAFCSVLLHIYVKIQGSCPSDERSHF